MKRILICTVLSLGMILPGISEARGYHGGSGYGHGGYSHDYYHGHDGYHGNDFGRAVALPLILGAAAVGLVADIVTAPFQAVNYAPPPVVYYPPQPVYQYAPPPPQTCTYYSDGSSYCR